MWQQLGKSRSGVAPPRSPKSLAAALATLPARLRPQRQSVPKGQSLLAKPRIDTSLSQGQEEAEGGFIPPQPLSLLWSHPAAAWLAQTTLRQWQHTTWSPGVRIHPAAQHVVGTAHCTQWAEQPRAGITYMPPFPDTALPIPPQYLPGMPKRMAAQLHNGPMWNQPPLPTLPVELPGGHSH